MKKDTPNVSLYITILTDVYKRQTHSADETFSLGFRLASQKIFKSGSIVCFSGEMGSGKTVFIQGALKGMGYDGDVNSTTFALMNVYEANIKVLHYDLYRLNGYDDLYSIGLFDDIGKDNCTFIEWSENADGFLPDGCIFITIEYGGKENERKIKAVSYTHLDVYKRQHYSHTIILSVSRTYVNMKRAKTFRAMVP